MIKQINHYLPFFIITLIIYGLFFYYHKQSTFIPMPLNSGQQAVQLQFIEIAKAVPEKAATSEPAKNPRETKTQSATIAEEVETTTQAIEPTTKPSETKIENATIVEKVETPTPAIEPAIDPSEAKIENAAIVEEVETTTQAIEPTTKPSETKIENAAIVEEVETTTQAIEPTTKPSETKIENATIAEEEATQAIEPQENIRSSSDSTAALKAELFSADIEAAFHVNGESAATKTELPLPVKSTEKRTVPTQTKKIKTVFKKKPSTNDTQIETQGVLQEAIVVSGNIPTYPKRAILRNQQGRVVVKLIVNTRGKAKNPTIVLSSGHDILDNAILDFIQTELFMPAHKGEEKITTEQLFSFRFELK